jgi:hypothetical protein
MIQGQMGDAHLLTWFPHSTDVMCAQSDETKQRFPVSANCISLSSGILKLCCFLTELKGLT